MEELKNFLIKQVNNNVFTGSALGFSKWRKGEYRRFTDYCGYTDNGRNKIRLTRDHFFDLASLTKPLATGLILFALFEKKILSPEDTVSSFIKNCPGDKGNIRIKELMAHSAGFPPHREYFRELRHIAKENKKSFLLDKLLDEKVDTQKGSVHCYSDLGYMLLGVIIEKITGKSLGVLAEDLVYKPLGLHNDLFYPGLDEKRDRIYVSTEKCLWGGERLSGVVHDDNCRALDGECGHAGLFGTLNGVISLCENILDQWSGRRDHPSYEKKIIREALVEIDASGWTMGFDMVAGQGSSSGGCFSKKSVGHLGFTGTSFWIDPDQECMVVWLTNRVYFGRDNSALKKLRPRVHDMLMKELL